MIRRKILIPVREDLMNANLFKFLLEFGSNNDFELVIFTEDAKLPAEYTDTLINFLSIPGVSVVGGLRDNAIDAINELCESRAIDLVALTGLYEAKTIAAALQRPMIFFPFGWQPKDIKKIGFACDNDTIRDSSVLTILWHLARELKAEVYTVHVSKEKINHWSLEETIEDTLEFYLQDIDHHYDFVQGDNITKTILDYADAKGLDLLMTMPRDHQINSNPNGGKITNKLMEACDIPLMTVD